MFEFDFDLDLGSRRRQTEWVSVASEPEKPNKLNKRQRQRQREQKKKAAAAAGSQHSTACGKASITPAQAKYRKEYRDSSVVCLSTEIESGNVEYKYCLSGCISNPNRRHQLVTQMKYRLSEGGGECFYYIGVEDDGYPRGLDPKELADTMAIISSMAASLAATARLVEYVKGGFGRRAALMHIKANAEEGMKATDLRVAVAGNMDSGKSTLVAVLTHGCDGRPLLDNCRGSARMAVFRHKHEIETGRTSSISQQVLGYDDEGRVLNYVGVAAPTPADIAAAAARVLSFIDMGGHEKYLKTTLYGMTCTLPDYVLLCVDAQCGVTPITREHLAVAVALEIPTALVITKSDAVDNWQLQAVHQQLQQLIAPVLSTSQQHTAAYEQGASQQGGALAAQDTRESGTPAASAAEVATAGAVGAAAAENAEPARRCVGVPMITTESQASSLAATLSELHSCTEAAAASFHQMTFPVFTVSCVTGAGLSLLHAFLSKLQPVSTYKSNLLQRGMAGSAGAAASAAVADTNSSQPKAPGDFSSIHLLSNASEQEELESSSDDDWEQQLAEFCADDMPETRQQQQRQHVLDLEGHSSLWLCEQHGATSEEESNAAAQPPASGAGTAGNADVNEAAAAAAGSVASGAIVQPPGHFQVVHTYDVEGVGWVVSGIAVSGTIEVGQSLLWGPTLEGGFTPVSVSCIQRSHVPVRQVQAGQTATLALQQEGPGVTPNSSKEALLSAAAAAQAAAEAAAAREAAAACAAAPNISFGKPHAFQKGSGHLAQAHTVVPGQAAGLAAAAATNGQGPVAGGCVDDSSYDMLADDLAADLSVDDAVDGSSSATGGSSECGLEGFGGFDDECVTNSSVSHSASFSSMKGEPIAAGSSTIGLVVGLPGAASAASSPAVAAANDSRQVLAAADADIARKTAPKPVPAAASARQHSSNALLGCSPSNWRSKGAVLLDAAAAPKTYWEFEVLLVLLGGHWPARGLLSGCWPPGDLAADAAGASQECQQRDAPWGAATTEAAIDAPSIATGQEAGVPVASAEATAATGATVGQATADPSVGKRQANKQRSKRYDYAYVIHCNSIRQIARVVHMKEHADISSSSLSDGLALHPRLGSPGLMQHCGLSASIQAAAALLQNQSDGSSGADSGGGSSGGSSGSGMSKGNGSTARRGRRGSADLGTVVAVRFRFTHRPEWMQVGARMIVRDRSDGHVAAAGFVTQLLDAHSSSSRS